MSVSTRSGNGLITVAVAVTILLVTLSFGYLTFRSRKALNGELSTTRSGKVNPLLLSPSPAPEASPTPAIKATDTTNWKTYTDVTYSFSFKYPPDYFINTGNLSKDIRNTKSSKLLFELGDNKDFSRDEFAFVVSGFITLEKPKTIAGETELPLKKIEIKKLGLRIDTEIFADFLGNPPWGNYIVTVALNDKNGSYLEISARVHSDNEVQINAFNDFLSTFKLTDKRVSCSDIKFEAPELTFLQSYCQGDICSVKKTQAECEAVDVVGIENGRLLDQNGADGVPDCLWDSSKSSLNRCLPRY